VGRPHPGAVHGTVRPASAPLPYPPPDEDGLTELLAQLLERAWRRRHADEADVSEQPPGPTA
jgi:hypothetical protein